MRSMRGSSLLVVSAVIAGVLVAPTARAAPPPASVGPSGARTIRLITGDSAVVVGSGPSARVVFRPAGAHGGSVLRFGGRTLVVPSTARPYVGGILDPSLFDVGMLHGDVTQLPVTLRLSSASARPSAPGLVILSRSGANAHGYLDLSKAQAFGEALAAQWQHDAGRGRPSSAILGGITRLASSALSPPVRPQYPQMTLILKAVDPNGRPAESGLSASSTSTMLAELRRSCSSIEVRRT